MPDNDIARNGRPDNAGRRRRGVARLIRSRRAQLAAGAANFVVAREQYYPHSGCAATFAAESTRAFLPSTYRLTPWVDQRVHGNYSITAHFGAANLGKHGMCAYLISLSSGNTHAHGGIFWTNHTSASRPCTEAPARRCTAPPAT